MTIKAPRKTVGIRGLVTEEVAVDYKGRTKEDAHKEFLRLQVSEGKFTLTDVSDLKLIELSYTIKYREFKYIIWCPENFVYRFEKRNFPLDREVLERLFLLPQSDIPDGIMTWPYAERIIIDIEVIDRVRMKPLTRAELIKLKIAEANSTKSEEKIMEVFNHVLDVIESRMTVSSANYTQVKFNDPAFTELFNPGRDLIETVYQDKLITFLKKEGFVTELTVSGFLNTPGVKVSLP
jgi:hypothetical protein